jgi:hypothetical protein
MLCFAECNRSHPTHTHLRSIERDIINGSSRTKPNLDTKTAEQSQSISSSKVHFRNRSSWPDALDREDEEREDIGTTEEHRESSADERLSSLSSFLEQHGGAQRDLTESSAIQTNLFIYQFQPSRVVVVVVIEPVRTRYRRPR